MGIIVAHHELINMTIEELGPLEVDFGPEAIERINKDLLLNGHEIDKTFLPVHPDIVGKAIVKGLYLARPVPPAEKGKGYQMKMPDAVKRIGWINHAVQDIVHVAALEPFAEELWNDSKGIASIGSGTTWLGFDGLFYFAYFSLNPMSYGFHLHSWQDVLLEHDRIMVGAEPIVYPL